MMLISPCAKLFKTHGKMDSDAADDYVAQMQQSRRYLKDVY